MQQMFLRSTKPVLSSKDLRKKLNWISIKPSLPSSESTPYVNSSPSAPSTIFVSPKSIARTPSSTVEVISRYTCNNLKDSLTPIILTPRSCSTKHYMVSSKHHVYGTYFYQKLL